MQHSDASADVKRCCVAVNVSSQEETFAERSIGYFVDRGTRLMERMLLQAALHVRMTEAQRKLYRRYVCVEVAEEHMLTNT